MSTFIWHNGKPQAMRKYNDDLIMSCAIGCWVKDIVYETNQRDIEYQKAFLNSMSKSTNKINTTIPGMIGYNKKLKEQQKQHKDQMEEFGWILKG
jgi:predicted metal-dependent HD superfamily phosphohydrolase